MKRYAFAGASGRAVSMYAQPLREHFTDSATMVGVFDINQTRARHLANEAGGMPTFDDFDRMLAETKPDAVIVTTIDRLHHEFIVRALHSGCDAITEKPMTIDAPRCRAILRAEVETGRKVAVTFNYRYTEYNTRIKQLIANGAIGRVLGVDFEWFLDTRHGADYFRRWHRRKENSGGLFVHKATHHFDLINWWQDAEPRDVFAFGARHVYGSAGPERGERCSSCAIGSRCRFFVDFAADPKMRAFYFAAEHEDDYMRDGCVFAEEVDIEDTMSATVRYASGALLSYSLVAHSAHEGWRVAINGADGRIEAEEYHSGPFAGLAEQTIRLIHGRGEIENIVVPAVNGGHGGGDALLRESLFSIAPPPDPLGHSAGSRAGAMSLLIGAAANRSIATGQRIAIADLL
ncbi:MAG: Gfo/Idh/MocA family oxidoreductase [Chloroflexota bacterium]|nr:MAG: Gfo/Idh/MocA family oxidoreductase [Chloroflexota bacterium]